MTSQYYNPEKAKEYYHENKERIKESQKKRRLNPDKRKADMVAVARCRARKKNKEFNMKWTDLVWPEVCPLLGLKINYEASEFDGASPSIDRKDSSKGYTKENCWIISRRANTIKSDATLEELKLLVVNLDYLLSR